MKASDFLKDKLGSNKTPDLSPGRRALRSADRTFDNVVLVLLILMLMFVGGCASSTGGGIKVIRILVLLKLIRIILKKINYFREKFKTELFLIK